MESNTFCLIDSDGARCFLEVKRKFIKKVVQNAPRVCKDILQEQKYLFYIHLYTQIFHKVFFFFAKLMPFQATSLASRH